jgi:hypothetical protein
VKKHEKCNETMARWDSYLRCVESRKHRTGSRRWRWNSLTLTPEQFRREADAICSARHPHYKSNQDK